jgi:hypothetical protein
MITVGSTATPVHPKTALILMTAQNSPTRWETHLRRPSDVFSLVEYSAPSDCT